MTLKPFKSGPDPEDLYRTLSTGLSGTPMPSYANAFSPKDRWALVSYILSIATNEKPRGMMGLVGEEIDGMRIDMRAAMAGMMKGGGMMRGGGGMMNRDRDDEGRNGKMMLACPVGMFLMMRVMTKEKKEDEPSRK